MFLNGADETESKMFLNGGDETDSRNSKQMLQREVGEKAFRSPRIPFISQIGEQQVFSLMRMYLSER